MKQRYSIWGWEHGSDHEVEILQVDSNPETMRKALGMKMLNVTLTSGKRKSSIPRYTFLRIVENTRR
jgi:hypothetical protein